MDLESLLGIQRFSSQECFCDKTACIFFRPIRWMYIVFSLSFSLVPSCLMLPHLGVKPLQSFQKSKEWVLLLVTGLSP